MKITRKQVAEYLRASGVEFEFTGDESLGVEGFCSIGNPKPHAVTWIKKLQSCDTSALKPSLGNLVITNMPYRISPIEGVGFIQCDNPKRAFFSILAEFFSQKSALGIADDSTVATMRIGNGVTIGHRCYIGEDVVIGDGVHIDHNVVIQCKATIGAGTIIHSGTVIGTDGFGFFDAGDGSYGKVQHYGGVQIGRNVEIGANVCIDRGTIDDTIIGDGVKIDNLCQIAHNVVIEDNVVMPACSCLAGSSRINEHAYIGPCSFVMNQTTVGSNSRLSPGTVTLKNIPNDAIMYGNPAKKLW